MKKRMFLLALTAALLLSGCTSMLERSHVSATAHVDYSVTEDSSILRTETYQGLVNAIIYFVNERTSGGTIRLYNYTGDVDADLSRACDEVLHDDPLGAFSVRNIVSESTRILTYYEVKLTITYSRSEEAVAAIREVSGTSALRQELADMVSARDDSRTLLVSYFAGDRGAVEELLTLARLARPELYHGSEDTFSCKISLYPETGSRRIIEIEADGWHSPGTDMEEYSRALDDTCRQLLQANPPAGSSYTPEELASILRSASGGYEYHGSSLALDALQGGVVNETGYLLAMEYLCQHCGIDAMPVVSGNGRWLIISTEDGYRHLLPGTLHLENTVPLPLYTDDELRAAAPVLQWNAALYPACESRGTPN